MGLWEILTPKKVLKQGVVEFGEVRCQSGFGYSSIPHALFLVLPRIQLTPYLKKGLVDLFDPFGLLWLNLA